MEIQKFLMNSNNSPSLALFIAIPLLIALTQASPSTFEGQDQIQQQILKSWKWSITDPEIAKLISIKKSIDSTSGIATDVKTISGEINTLKELCFRDLLRTHKMYKEQRYPINTEIIQDPHYSSLQINKVYKLAQLMSQIRSLKRTDLSYDQDKLNDVKGKGNEIYGRDNRINGNQNAILGNLNSIEGHRNAVFGSNNWIQGLYNGIAGEKNTVTGKQNYVSGQYNQVNGNGNEIYGTGNIVLGQGQDSSKYLNQQLDKLGNYINGQNNFVWGAGNVVY